VSTDRDDRAAGHLLTRREALALLGTGALAAWPSTPLLAAGNAAACIATPEQTEGPFFLDTKLERADIRSDPADGTVRDGVSLTLMLGIQQLSAAGCVPLAGAVVDVWHCDAAGEYSGTSGSQRFLRGYQIADRDGSVQFVTIYPGWYPGRAVHVHFKVRSGSREFASQFYFDDALSERVFAKAPYVRQGRGKLRNDQDFLFRAGGRQLLLAPAEKGNGFVATYTIGLRA
jgi:protocatechuate 3,4-dioxygenase beta subunit